MNIDASGNVFSVSQSNLKFPHPIVYAKSLDGLVFKGNKVIQNNDYEPFHWNRHRFLLEKVTNVTIEGNDFQGGFDPEKDVKYND